MRNSLAPIALFSHPRKASANCRLCSRRTAASQQVMRFGACVLTRTSALDSLVLAVDSIMKISCLSSSLSSLTPLQAMPPVYPMVLVPSSSLAKPRRHSTTSSPLLAFSAITFQVKFHHRSISTAALTITHRRRSHHYGLRPRSRHKRCDANCALSPPHLSSLVGLLKSSGLTVDQVCSLFLNTNSLLTGPTHAPFCSRLTCSRSTKLSPDSACACCCRQSASLLWCLCVRVLMIQLQVLGMRERPRP